MSAFAQIPFLRKGEGGEREKIVQLVELIQLVQLVQMSAFAQISASSDE